MVQTLINFSLVLKQISNKLCCMLYCFDCFVYKLKKTLFPFRAGEYGVVVMFIRVRSDDSLWCIGNRLIDHFIVSSSRIILNSLNAVSFHLFTYPVFFFFILSFTFSLFFACERESIVFTQFPFSVCFCFVFFSHKKSLFW